MFSRSGILCNHQAVVAAFKQFAELHTLLGDKYRAKAYTEAARSLEAYEILQLSQKKGLYTRGKEVSHLPGIGEKLALKIDEILATGSLAELVEAQKQPGPAAVRELTRVHGIGPVTAMSLFKAFGISTVDQLREKYEKSLENTESKPLLTPAQALGLQYLDEIEQRIPREEVAAHEEFIRTIIKQVLGETPVVCGSYRRGLPSVGDVDALVPSSLVGKSDARTKKEWQALLDAVLKRFQTPHQVTKHVYHIGTLAQGPTKWMTISRLEPKLPARRVDFRFIPELHFPAALLYFTGSKQFNIEMRAKAAAKGFLLNEYGLFRLHQAVPLLDQNIDTKKSSKKQLKQQLSMFSLDNVSMVESDRVPAKSEKDIFDALNMPFVEPENR